MVVCRINGIPIKFPFEPYAIQLDYMSKVIECLQNDQNGVLESPTGTGKTMSLLCASLAWLEWKKAQMQAQIQTKGFPSGNDGNNVLGGQLNSLGRMNSVNRGAFAQLPQIIYLSRTHAQLSQAMNELKRTSYKDVKASILGSREQMCIHPEIKQFENNSLKTQMCRIKVRSRSCLYNNNVEREKDNPVFSENCVIDIEDLVKFGVSQKFCPYYMSKELKRRADIVFMPYNYILDPRTRKALGVEHTNSVIIFDEAHNVEKACEDAASHQIKSTDVTLCIEEATEVMKAITAENNEFAFGDSQPDFSAQELMMLRDIFLKFKAALDAVDIINREGGSDFDGNFIFKLFDDAGVTDKNHLMVSNLIDRICTFLVTVREGPCHRKGHGMQLFDDLLQIAFASTASDFKEKMQKCYKVHVKIDGDVKSNWVSGAIASKRECRVLSFWCLSPSLGMNMLMRRGVKCVILTSGSLSPLKPLIAELELNVGVRLVNPHIVKGDQVCVKILSRGSDGTELNGSYKNRTNPAYIKSLGMTICNLTRLIPDGLLIFFSSYPIMRQCQERWQKDGFWARIGEQKRIYVEPREKQAFAKAMVDYYNAIHESGSKGAIFMGVCRGKVSEGLDFIDANARAVIITGLPYPPMKEPRVILKQQYLDACRARNKEYFSGKEWYSLEATKAVNQAVGRVIRHGKDYGAIILLDSRYDNPQINNQMSMWLRPHVENVNYGEILRGLPRFFRDAENKFPVKERKNLSDKLTITESASFTELMTRYRRRIGGTSRINEVKINKRGVNRIESTYKRTKFSIKTNIPCGGSSNSVANDEKRNQTAEVAVLQDGVPSINDIKEYLTLVQLNLADEYDAFITSVKKYLANAELEALLSTLQAILNHKPTLTYLLTGMRSFLLAEHKEEYDKFLVKWT